MKKLLIVGPCYADAVALKKFLESKFPVKTTELTKISEATDFLKQRSCDLILVSRVCKGDNKPCLDLVKYVKSSRPDVPIFMLTRFPEAQEEALKNGATATFDMDLLIGYIRPSMKSKYEDAIKRLEGCLK
ncbi:MAG: hypothetical protein ABH864_05760 [archaeon]